MSNYRRYEKHTLASSPWWPYLKYGALIVLAIATVWVVFMAVAK